MTKAELEIEYKKALDKIEEQKHLASAVDAKDREMAQLREKHLNDIKSFDAEWKTRLKHLEESQETSKRNVADSYENRIKYLENENKIRVKELDQVLRVHGSLLKTLQGTIDNAIELNELIFNNIIGGN